ncbi:MAG: PA14 domain-containing protein [Solirubrobacteraceae bacterium]
MSHRTARTPINVLIAIGLALAGLALASAAGAATPAVAGATYPLQVQSVSPWKQNAAITGWSSSLNRVFYNSPGADGIYDAYSANPNGSDPQCLTCTQPSFANVGTATNRGVSDVSPNGQYMLLTIEGDHLGAVGSSLSQPGKGADNDIWLATTSGSQFWQLTTPSSSGLPLDGIIWPRFDRTGNEIVWAQMTTAPLFSLGSWELRVADIVWTGGAPSLADVRVIQPSTDDFYEPYGFSPDDQRILFASDINMPGWVDTQIDSIGVDGTGLARLTPADTPTGTTADYNEFAFYTPDGRYIVAGRGHDAISGGLDYWVMGADGSDPQHLTYFEQPWETETLGHSSVGSLAFDPSDPDVFIAGVTQGSASNAYEVTLSPPSTTSGLTAQYFDTTSFTGQVAAGVGNPSSGYMEDGSPAPGVPAHNYSIRWSGTVTPPTTGTYSFCTVAEWTDKLYVGGSLLVNGTASFGQRRCATVAERAGVPTPIQMNYEHGPGTALMQLSWIPPGATAPTEIPATDLSPTSVAASSTAAPSSGDAGAATADGTTTADGATTVPGTQTAGARWHGLRRVQVTVRAAARGRRDSRGRTRSFSRGAALRRAEAALNAAGIRRRTRPRAAAAACAAGYTVAITIIEHDSRRVQMTADRCGRETYGSIAGDVPRLLHALGISPP